MMRLYKTMKQYFLLTLLTVLMCSCHGHEHHNQIDPVTAKYSQSATNIDALGKPLDANAIPTTDDTDDDTIDARLRAKQSLRNSIHQQSSDEDLERNAREEDYIKKLNAPLEDDLQFQDVPPPIAETPNNILGQVLTNETIPKSLPVENETVSITVAPPVAIQAEEVQAQTISTPAPITIDIVKPIKVEDVKINETQDDKPVIKPIVDEVKSILEKQNAKPQPLDETTTVTEPPPTITATPSSEPVNRSHSPQPATLDQPAQNITIPEPPAEEKVVPIEPIPTATVPSVKVDEVKPVVTASPAQPKVEETLTTTRTPPRVLRSSTSRFQQKAQAARQRQVRSKSEPENVTEESFVPPLTPATPIDTVTVTESTTVAATLTQSTTVATPIESVTPTQSTTVATPIEPVTTVATTPTESTTIVTPVEPVTTVAPLESVTTPEILVQAVQPPALEPQPTAENQTAESIDLPRQVHVHDTKTLLHAVAEEQKKESLTEQVETSTTSNAFLSPEHTSHLPRILEADTLSTTIETMTTTAAVTMMMTAETESTPTLVQTQPKEDETNSSLSSNNATVPLKLREVCWNLPKTVHPTLDLIENQMLRVVAIFPEFLQTIFFSRIDNPEVVINTLWLGSICVLCFFFSLFFLTLATSRLRQSQDEKAIRARCQQLQQYNHQLELDRATFERQNQKLTDEIDELKVMPVRDSDEELFEMKDLYQRLQTDFQTLRAERDAFYQEIEQKNRIIQKHDSDLQKQVETVAHLNHELLQRKEELEKERRTIAQLQTNDLSLERFEKFQETIHDLKGEINELKQEKFRLNDQLREVQEQANQLDVENNQLTIKMKQLKDLVEQRDETISRIRERMSSERETSSSDLGDLLSNVSETRTEQNQELFSTIDNEVEKSNQHLRQLHNELDEKTRRIKELDGLLIQEKDRCREMETKLKVVLELRERDAHLHIRQLGQTDAELRKARTDTERVRILQQQLDLKQKQLEDVQKEMENDKTKYTEEFSKLQHGTHEKWMEVKRLTRELEAAKKECEALRRQITKYAANDRSSQEKTMLKPVPQHLNNTGRLSSEPETNGSSPPPPPSNSSYQQGENFRPIDHQRNDSGAASPAEIFGPRPPLFPMARPPFFAPPFLPPPNPFMMAPRFPMGMPGPHGMISPISHLMTNGSAGGSDANSFEIVDSTNITPNSTSYDAALNGSAVSPTPDDEHQPTTTKTKKTKKTVKKKSKTPTTAAAAATDPSTSMMTEDV